MGRIPLDRLRRRRRGGVRQPQRAPDDPVLPRARGRGHRAVPAPVRDRRGDRGPGIRRPQARLRGAAAADPPGGQPGDAARQPDTGPLHRVRPARPRRRRLHRAAVRAAPGGAGRDPLGRERAPPPDPGDHRPRRGAAVAPAVRGGRPGRDHRQAAGGHLRAGQAGHVQGQARADRRLRGGRVPDAQVRPGRDRLTPARPVPRHRGPGQRRRHRRVPDGPPGASCSPSSSRWSPRSTTIRGTGRARRRGRGPLARPSTADGTLPRTCPSPRCGQNGWWRSATTTWRARGSGTPPSSRAGGPTATRVRAPTTSWRSR